MRKDSGNRFNQSNFISSDDIHSNTKSNDMVDYNNIENSIDIMINSINNYNAAINKSLFIIMNINIERKKVRNDGLNMKINKYQEKIRKEKKKKQRNEIKKKVSIEHKTNK